MIDAATRARIVAAVAAHARREGPLLEVLHQVQRDFGHIPEGAVAVIAEELNLSRAEVHGVVTFYHYFRRTPPGRHSLRICRAEACQSMGSDKLQKHARDTLGVDFGATTRDGAITLEAVYCLGLCACAPALMLDDEVHGKVTADTLDQLIRACAAPAGGTP
jgi:formate dehydrogenase subunit gamma